MVKALVFDFSRTLLFPKDKDYRESLNSLYFKHRDEMPFDWNEYFKLNHELLEFLAPLKEKYVLTIFTTGVVQEHPPILNTLSRIFSSIYNVEGIGKEKNDPEAYKIITEKLRFKTGELLFIDDEPKNLEAARKSGLKVVQYTSNQEMFRFLKNLEV